MSRWGGFRSPRSKRVRTWGDCGGAILPGEVYHRWVGRCAEEDVFFTAVCCDECRTLWKEATDESGEPMWFGGLGEELEAGRGCGEKADELWERYQANKTRRRGLFPEAPSLKENDSRG